MPRRPQGKLTQTERAYAKLKQAILQGEIAEGTFLSEPDVMTRLGIGRTPYREACNRLHHEGLLQAVPRRGYFVSEMTFHSVCDLFEVRLILEDAVAQLATVRATDEEIDALAALAARPLPVGKSLADLTQFIQANANFHLSLAKTTRNRDLLEHLARNLDSTERLMYIELRSGRFHDNEFRTLHGRIVEALRKRDVNAVRQAVWADITEAQRTTLTLGQERPTHALLIANPRQSYSVPVALKPDLEGSNDRTTTKSNR
jgi:DNA-binding GntR family transcriptional regulator